MLCLLPVVLSSVGLHSGTVAGAQEIPLLVESSDLDAHCPDRGTFVCLLAEEDFALASTGMPGSRKAILTNDDGLIRVDDRLGGTEVKFEPSEGDYDAAVKSWYFRFVGRDGQDFGPGVYDGAVEDRRTPGESPMIGVTAWSSACTSEGRFEVREMGTDERDVIRRLHLDFQLRCDHFEKTGALVGRICIDCRGSQNDPEWRGLVLDRRVSTDPETPENVRIELVVANRSGRAAPFVTSTHRLFGSSPVAVRSADGHCHTARPPAYRRRIQPPVQNTSRLYRRRDFGPVSNHVFCYFGTVPAGEQVKVDLVVKKGSPEARRPGADLSIRHVAIIGSADADLLPDSNRCVDELGGESPASGGAR